MTHSGSPPPTPGPRHPTLRTHTHTQKEGQDKQEVLKEVFQSFVFSKSSEFHQLPQVQQKHYRGNTGVQTKVQQQYYRSTIEVLEECYCPLLAHLREGEVQLSLVLQEAVVGRQQRQELGSGAGSTKGPTTSTMKTTTTTRQWGVGMGTHLDRVRPSPAWISWTVRASLISSTGGSRAGKGDSGAGGAGGRDGGGDEGDGRDGRSWRRESVNMRRW